MTNLNPINHLDAIFSTPSAVKVLRILAGSELDLSGRQIASLAGLNPQTTQNTLDHLNDMGLLAVRQVGRAKLYRFRPGHIHVVKLLAPLFAEEKVLLAGAEPGTTRYLREPAPDNQPARPEEKDHKENDKP